MHAIEAGVVQDQDGVRGTVIRAASPLSQGVARVTVQLETGERVQVPVEALRQQSDGIYYVPLRLAELRSTDRERSADPDIPLVVPVVAEEFDIQRRTIETGKVRITKAVHTREVLVDEPSWYDKVEITHVPIHRVVDGPIPVRYEGDTMIVSILEEEVVVEKRLVLKEELHVRVRRTETHQPQHITIRSEEAHIERLPHTQQTVRQTDVDVDRAAAINTETIEDRPHRTAATAGFEACTADFRRHHTSAFASGEDYNEYEPAYRYGYDLYADARYRNRDWSALEDDARRDWETSHPGTWERFKDAIRYGWNSMKTRS